MIQKVLYVLIFPNGKKYVGYSCERRGIVSRWWSHKCEAYRVNGEDYNSKKNRAIRKYGWKNIEKKILLLSDDVLYCKDMETQIIAAWNLRDDKYGYNMTAGGDGQISRECSLETKKKISESNKGKLAGNKHHMAKIRRFKNIKTGDVVEGNNAELSRIYGWNMFNMSGRGKSKGWEMLDRL
jgi:hypothetical protein